MKVQMVEISGNKAQVGEKERERKRGTWALKERKREVGKVFSLFFSFSKIPMGRETRKVSSTWWLSGPVVVTVPSGGGVSDDDGGSA